MKNKLHENQLRLLRHLARFQLLSYSDCLELLDTEGTKDRAALSYAFRPLTKSKYISKQRDGGVSILAKGRALFPETEPLISTGGGIAERRRVMAVSRIAALMERNGVPVVREPIDTDQPYFIPSACWRKIVPGILSTTRFAGMLIVEEKRIAVYDIGDGRMEWQGRAEGSLFYPQYGTYEVQATGMLLVCQDGVRNRVAEQIIRYTMWQRRQLLRDRRPSQRERPVRWSRAPIRLRKLYGRVYLTTPARFRQDLDRIRSLPGEIQARCGDGIQMGTLERALPGRQNARDWLTLKIVECLSEPMDDRGAEKLATYNTAYKALEQWPEDDPPAPSEPFTLTTAKNWVKRMKNEDGTTGAHWTFDQAHQLMEQTGIDCDPVQFWAALCMMYSDYATAASKHGVGGDVDFYIDMACVFLNDKDAPKDKLSRYYEHIAKG